MHTTKDVPITSISSTFQIRESTDEKHVQEIMQSIQDDGWRPGEFLDVIQPDPEQEKFKLADGNHRLQALKRLGWTEAPIRIIGSTDLDLYKQAYKVNAGHGVRLTRAEKEHFIKEMLKLYCGVLNRWSLPRFVKEFEISKPTAEKYKAELEATGFEFPETSIGLDGRERKNSYGSKKDSTYKILYVDEQKPDSKTGMIFCANGCGTPTYPEHLEAGGSTWIQKEGHWFCSEECADEWNQNRLSDEAERLTGISDKLPANPTAKLPTKSNPINYPSCPAIPVKTDSRAVSGDVLENFTDVDEQKDVFKVEIPLDADEEAIFEAISDVLEKFALTPSNININNIINKLINKYNYNITTSVERKISNVKKSSKKPQEPLSEEEKTGFVWKLNDGSDWELPKSELEKFKTLYPAVDVEQELRNSIGWNMSYPNRRKTKSGMMGHLNTWLTKQQNKGGGQSGYGNTNQGQRQNRSRYRDAGLSFEDVIY